MIYVPVWHYLYIIIMPIGDTLYIHFSLNAIGIVPAYLKRHGTPLPYYFTFSTRQFPDADWRNRCFSFFSSNSARA